TLFGLPLVPERAVLVPTAHDEPAIGLSLYRRVFHLPRAIAFNTAEERAMVHRRFANARVPNEIVGVGVDLPSDLQGGPHATAPALAARAERFRSKHGIEGPFFLYLGRIVESKGLQDLWDLWAAWRSPAAPRATLVLAGHREMPIPQRADINYVGTLTEDEKWDAFAACTALVVPERLQSLSLVTLEAWSVGRPVICPAAAPVLASMSRRASAGVPYRTAPEFAEICEILVERPDLAHGLGARGREFVARTYSWPVVVEKYLDLFAEVRARNG
ncbi:MAG TPA: glycosyltransferase family 4 protein, partial [Thermoanaerobaculia bacterium]|nr:glycosyltransferase family 4 protein [Thermoanaerobaculia bacterium]